MFTRKGNDEALLPRPIDIPNVATLATLGDVRALIESRLPLEYRGKAPWCHVAAAVDRAGRRLIPGRCLDRAPLGYDGGER